MAADLPSPTSDREVLATRTRRSTSRSIRRRLLVLVASVALPMTGISLFAAYTIFHEERRASTTAALETARALSLVADREVAYRAGVLRTLAASKTLDQPDLNAFHEQALTLAPAFNATLILVDPQGRQLVSTLAPPGTPLPLVKLSTHPANAQSYFVSDLYDSPNTKRPSFAVRLPVERGGVARYMVAMGSDVKVLHHIFERQPLPEGWTGTVLDRTGRVLARNRGGDAVIGLSASKDMLAQLAKQREGVVEALTLDKTPVMTAFTHATESGWSVLIAVPRAAMRQSALNALATMMAVTFVLSGMGLLAASHLGRRIAQPLRRLRDDADRLGHGDEIAAGPSTGLDEADDVQRAMAEASRKIREADVEMIRRVETAVEEAERAQQVALNVQKVEALGRLTAGIAHDFNNLLQTMSTGIRMASMLATHPRAQNALAACERAVAKAVTLTRQLMTFGKSQPGLLKVIDLAQHLPNLQELLRGALHESIALHVHVEERIWPVQVDPVQFELAVLNLVINGRDAIDGMEATQRRPGEITIAAANIALGEAEVAGLAKGHYVAVTVSDNGRGIEPNVLARMFEPFFSTKPAGKGTGLGLAQVMGFAKQLGGGVTASSELGRGTWVTLMLPAARDAVVLPVNTADASTLPPAYSGTLLLVEDDALVRGLAKEAFENLGFDVVAASNADAALAIVRTQPNVDAVLSDIVMPGEKSGFDLATILRSERPALPVVLASGYAEHQNALLDIPILAKPYDVRAVAQLIASKMQATAAKN